MGQGQNEAKHGPGHTGARHKTKHGGDRGVTRDGTRGTRETTGRQADKGKILTGESRSIKGDEGARALG